MTKTPNEAAISAWIALLKSSKLALGFVESSLKAEGFPSLTWYDVLWELDRASSEGLSLNELEKRLLLSQYNVSRLVKRMEAEGLISRRTSLEDKRSQQITLTKKGKDLRQTMWPVYAEALQTIIGENLTDRQASALVEILENIKNPKRT